VLELKYLKGDIAFALTARRADVDMGCSVVTERSVSLKDALRSKAETASVVNELVSTEFWCNDTDRRNNEIFGRKPVPVPLCPLWVLYELI